MYNSCSMSDLSDMQLKQTFFTPLKSASSSVLNNFSREEFDLRKRRGSDIPKPVSFNKKNEVKLRMPSIDGSSPVPGNNLHTNPKASQRLKVYRIIHPLPLRMQQDKGTPNARQGLKVYRVIHPLPLRMQQDKATPNATCSYKTQRCIEIPSIDTNKNSKNIKAICEERSQLQKTKCLGSVDPVTTHNVPTIQKSSNLGPPKQDVKVAKSKVKSGTRSKTPKFNIVTNGSSVGNSEISDSLYEPSGSIFEGVSSSPNTCISRYNLRNQSQILNKNITNLEQCNSQKRVLLLNDCSSVKSSPIKEKMASQLPNKRKPCSNAEQNKIEEATSSLSFSEQFATMYDSTPQKPKDKNKDSKVSLIVKHLDVGSQESQLVAPCDRPSLRDIVELERPYIKAPRSTVPEERRVSTTPYSTVAPFNFGHPSFVDRIVSQIRRCSTPQLGVYVSEQGTPMRSVDMVHHQTTSFNSKTPMSRYAMPHSQMTQSNNLQEKNIVKMQSKEDKHRRERYMTMSTVISDITESSSMYALSRVYSKKLVPRETHLPECQDGKKTQSNTMSLVDEKWDKLLSSPSLEKWTTVPKSNITSIIESLKIERFKIPDTRESIQTAIDDESEPETFDASSVKSLKNSRDFSQSSVQDAKEKRKSIVGKRSRASPKIYKKNYRSTSNGDVRDTILTKTPKLLDTDKQPMEPSIHSNWNIDHNQAGENSSFDDVNTYRDKIPLAHGKLNVVEQRRERSLSPYSEIRRASQDNIKCRILSQREEDLFSLSSSDDEKAGRLIWIENVLG